MEIFEMTAAHEKLEEFADYAESCSWKAGRTLAVKMRNESFRDCERVFAVYENGHPIGFCTFTESDSLIPRYLYRPFIGFIFVDEMFRGKKISKKIIDAVRNYSRINGYNRIYLTSGEKGLYEKLGFKKLGDNYETIYGTVEQLFMISS